MSSKERSTSVSQISNAFSTGGGGTNFEHRIGAFFLLSLLIDGVSPVQNEKPVNIIFQAKYRGYDVDDIVVITKKQDRECKLLCQAKHKMVVSERNKTFREVITAAWSDFHKPAFNRGNDHIALTVASIASGSLDNFRYLNQQACYASDEKDFEKRINTSNFTNEKVRLLFATVRGMIKKETATIPCDKDYWEFWKAFVVLLFDLDFEKSVNKTLALTLIQMKSGIDPQCVWASLVEYAAECAEGAASITIDNVASNIKDLFENEEKPIAPPKPIVALDDISPSLVLLGSWKSDNESDRHVVEGISQMDYCSFEAKAREMLINNPDYLSLSESRWKVQNREELLSQSETLFFTDSIKRAFTKASEIFAQENRKISRDGNKYSTLLNRAFDCSDEIRKGLSSGLALVVNRLEKFKYCSKKEIKDETIVFLRGLLQKADWVRWASLKDCLLNFAEINPDEYLNILEKELIDRKDDFSMLFPRKNADFMEANNISEILWSLEVLAWSPDYLIKAIERLVLLDKIPHDDTNWSNTPVNSIISILLPWCPQTLADGNKRKNAMNCLCKDDLEVAWDILIRMLPNHSGYSTANPKPRFIEMEILEEIKVTEDECRLQYQHVIQLALRYAQNSAYRLTILLDEIEYMTSNSRNEYFSYLEEQIKKEDDKKKKEFWISLINKKTKLRFQSLNNIDHIDDRMSALIKIAEPDSVFLRKQILYLGNDWSEEEGDSLEKWNRREEEKRNGVYEVFQEVGFDQMEKFAKAVNNESDVAYKLGNMLNEEEIDGLILSFSNEQIGTYFFFQCMGGFIASKGYQAIKNTDLIDYPDEFRMNVLSNLSYNSELLSVVKEMKLDEDIFWKKVTIPYRLFDLTKDELLMLINRLTLCQRYLSLVNLVGHSDFSTILSVEDAYKILMNAGTKNSKEDISIDSYAAMNIINWLQEKETPDIERLSLLEYIYLPFFDNYSSNAPKGLRARLGTDPGYFCEFVGLSFKKHSEIESPRKEKVDKATSERLFKIVFNFNVVPGTGWNGIFNAEIFDSWMKYVEAWSRENDRYEVTMQIVGTGLSYSNPNGEGLPCEEIMEVLNKIENDEIRRGYRIGMQNQRGVHWVDPEGKPEFELAKKFSTLADNAEELGYGRYADVLRKISKDYLSEAEDNIRRNEELIEEDT